MTTKPHSPPAHATHDLSIVAELAARPTDIDERTAMHARAQVAECDACADVLADLLAVRTTLPATSTPARPRDFRLTDTEAARLHRTGWRRALGFFGSPRDGFSRPLAIGLTTLGLAGLLFAVVPSMSLTVGLGGAASSKTLSAVGGPIQQAAPAPSAAAASAAGPAVPAASAAPSAPARTEALEYGAERSPAEAAAGAGPSDVASGPVDTNVFTGANPEEIAPDITGDGGLLAIRDDTSGMSVLFVVAGFLLIAGLGLFALRWSARRLH
jgi:hypothetical protein